MVSPYTSAGSSRCALVARSQTSYCSSSFVLRHRLTADEEAERLRDVLDLDAGFRGTLAIDRGAQFRFAYRQGGVDVDEARVGFSCAP